MADDQQAPPEDSRLAALEAKVDKLFDMFKGGQRDTGSETEPDQPASMAAEVRREVERLRAEEARQQADASRDERLTKLETVPERTPREYRKATNIMGWATDKDR